MIYSLTAQVESDFVFSTKCWKREILICNLEALAKVVMFSSVNQGVLEMMLMKD